MLAGASLCTFPVQIVFFHILVLNFVKSCDMLTRDS